ILHCDRELTSLVSYATRRSSDLVREALDRYFRNEKIKLLLAGDCGHWGSPPSRTSFVFDSMLRLSYFLGNYYPRGGSQAFADERSDEHTYELQSPDHIRFRLLL